MTENIEVLTHSSIRIKEGNRTIYLDPFQMATAPHDADFILITHDHHDHFSPEDIKKAANSGTLLVAPEKMQDKAPVKVEIKDNRTPNETGDSCPACHDGLFMIR